MSNRERGNFEGAIHHVWQRGNNREYIFQDSTTKGFFINQLKEYNKKFDYNLLAYVIMDNHYHLLIQTFKDAIGEVMFNINNVTGKFIKDNLKRSGHVFQGRYNSKLVQTNEYFLWLIRYIHRNPIRAKICNKVGDYSWSSHRIYLKGYSDFMNIDFPLSIFDSDKRKAIQLYLKLVNSEGDVNRLKRTLNFTIRS
jgi:REP element-mobilizing transposase RayT